MKSGRVQKVEFADPMERPEIFQLATALLHAWEARGEGAKAGSSYEVLSSAAKNFFALSLMGEVGKVAAFDHRVHESLGPAAEGRVVLLRPWVEHEIEGIRKVVIRGIVRQA